MFLSKLTLDTRHPQARRDLGDAYEMHRTLSRPFVADGRTPPARFLWRLERSADCRPASIVLVQSAQPANWPALDTVPGYAPDIQGNKVVDLEKLIQPNARYRFRLLANPTVTRAGKRYGLLREDEQLAWLARQGERYGFAVQGCIRDASERLAARQGKRGNHVILDTALFEGILIARLPERLRQGICNGVGHGKALGLGMLSLARIG